MRQSQVWKKRPAEMASEFRDQTKSWFDAVKLSGKLTATLDGGKRKSGLKRRRF